MIIPLSIPPIPIVFIVFIVFIPHIIHLSIAQRNTCEFTWDVVLVVLALASSIAGLIFGVQGYLED